MRFRRAHVVVLALVMVGLLCAVIAASCSSGPRSFVGGSVEDGQLVYVRWSEGEGNSVTGEYTRAWIDDETWEVSSESFGLEGTREGDQLDLRAVEGLISMSGTVEGNSMTLDYSDANGDESTYDMQAASDEEFDRRRQELVERTNAEAEEEREAEQAARRAREQAANGVLEAVDAAVSGQPLPEEYPTEVKDKLEALAAQKQLGWEYNILADDVGTMRITDAEGVTVSSWEHGTGLDDNEVTMTAELGGTEEVELRISNDDVGESSGTKRGRVSGLLTVYLRANGDQWQVTDISGIETNLMQPKIGEELFVSTEG